MCAALEGDDAPPPTSTLLARTEPLHALSEYDPSEHFALRYEVRARGASAHGARACGQGCLCACGLSPDCVTRPLRPPAAPSLQALIKRPFKAGRISLLLVRVDVCEAAAADGVSLQQELADDEVLRAPVAKEGGWLVHALHVEIEPAWEPLDPMHTWLDILPFGSE